MIVSLLTRPRNTKQLYLQKIVSPLSYGKPSDIIWQKKKRWHWKRIGEDFQFHCIIYFHCIYISKDVLSNNYFPKDSPVSFMMLSPIRLYVHRREKLLRRLNVRDDGSVLLDRRSKSRKGNQNARPLFIKMLD